VKLAHQIVRPRDVGAAARRLDRLLVSDLAPLAGCLRDLPLLVIEHQASQQEQPQEEQEIEAEVVVELPVPLLERHARLNG
jgi:hypothetical protein